MPVQISADQSASEIAEEFRGIRIPFESIPVIDLSPFRDGTARLDVANAIGRASRDVGFFYVVNHGIDEDTISDAMSNARAFFALPMEEKSRYPIADTFPHQRGYVPAFGEDLGMDGTVDLKESFDLGLDLPTDDPDVVAGVPFYHPNVWPTGMPTFRAAITRYHDGMLELSRTLGRAFALCLGLDEDYFVRRMRKPIANLRLLHYPPYSPIEGRKVVGAGAHSDYGFLTILLQDQVGGLQIQDTKGRWIEAPPRENSFVINIGEMLAMWTNDLFVATRHRVMNVGNTDRYSIPLFLDMDHDVRVECLPTCLAKGQRPTYAPINAGEYISGRLNETFPFRRNSGTRDT